jgi:hypothetical protein
MVVVVVVSLTGDRENRGHGTKDKGWLSVEFGLQRRAHLYRCASQPALHI